MKLHEFVEELSGHGVTLFADGDQLGIRARQGALTPDLRERIAARKTELLDALRNLGRHASQTDAAATPIVADKANRYSPFPLTDIQHAYWIGRGDLMALGNTGVHLYLETERDGVDPERLNRAFNALVSRHDMLRAIVEPSGEQRVLESVPEYKIAYSQFGQDEMEAANRHMAETRAALSHQVLLADRWPLFDIRMTHYAGNKVRLHISIDILIADLWSLFLLFSEWRQLYEQPAMPFPLLEVSFRDYVLAEHAIQDTTQFQAARSYWVKRLDEIYPAPDLPLAVQPEAITRPRFVRRSHALDRDTWANLRRVAGSAGITPSGLLLSAFAEVLTAWSSSPRFTLNLTLFNRRPVHSQVNALVGDFTSTILLAIDNSGSGDFTERAQRIQSRLYADLEHREFNGVHVLRELMQRGGGRPGAAMPVVFSSALGLESISRDGDVITQLGGQLGDVVYTITQTPQVWIDHQVFECDGMLQYNWDVVEELFPTGMLDDLFSAYGNLLQRLSDGETAWQSQNVISLPPRQSAIRARTNDTREAVSRSLLHEPVFEQARRRPQAEAVVCSGRRMTFGELGRESSQLARRLQTLGAKPNTLVAVLLDKGWEQVVAVLGVLGSGAAYLPIDPALPAARREHLLADGDVKVIVTRSDLRDGSTWSRDRTVVCLDDKQLRDLSGEIPDSVQQPEDLAYVIYTSGSTGKPKGVAIEHQAAMNTLVDINRRLAVGEEDRILAASALNFDLSVYDIFGILAAGGAVVMPDASDTREASHWWDLLVRERVTIWNSVPALFQMLVDHLQGTGKNPSCVLRAALLSGDWIPLDLPEKTYALWKDLRVISLGGATEASIWSIQFPVDRVDSDWRSIPYGKPLANQTFHVLDAQLRPCPEWVPGQLYIGGSGLARGYWRDDEKSRKSFIEIPHTGERVYRTGDMGRFLPDGNIEFLGREDYQVKVKGYRIELGEIESTLKSHPHVRDAVVCAIGERQGEKRLAAYIVENQEAGERRSDASGNGLPGDQIVKELREYLGEQIPAYMVPASFTVLDRIPLSVNGKVDRKALPDPVSPASPDGGAAPRSRLEADVAQVFASTLKIEAAGIRDSFFELGGDSLLATRLAANICKTFNIEFNLRDLFAGPTVEEVAARVSVLIGEAGRETDSRIPDTITEEEGEL